jgi:hypothetical protein
MVLAPAPQMFAKFAKFAKFANIDPALQHPAPGHRQTPRLSEHAVSAPHSPLLSSTGRGPAK